jgi:hypothetical protein
MAQRIKSGELEQFLIGLALQRNRDVLNDKKVRLSPKWLNRLLQKHRIAGLSECISGIPGREAKASRTMNRAMHVGD